MEEIDPYIEIKCKLSFYIVMLNGLLTIFENQKHVLNKMLDLKSQFFHGAWGSCYVLVYFCRPCWRNEKRQLVCGIRNVKLSLYFEHIVYSKISIVGLCTTEVKTNDLIRYK